MKILAIHNYYQQPGGEDQVFTAETALLEAHNHQVVRYTTHNNNLIGINPVTLAQITVWNQSVYNELRSLIRREVPDIVHFYNTFPLISPAAYYAAKAEGLLVIQALHNYRLLCPNALFYRNGHICEDCLGKSVPWNGIVHACYRSSRAASGAVATMLIVHRALQTWTKMVDVYVAGMTDFARQKFTEGGFPAEKIVLKPNFVHPDPRVGSGLGGYALFVGRLAPEKGLRVILDAWQKLDKKIPLKIIGDGPLAPQVAEATRQSPQIEWLGRKSLSELYSVMREAAFLVFPSDWYEAMPRTIIDSFALGTPVIASNIGAMSNLISHGNTGLHFNPGDSKDLAAQVDWLLAHPSELARMRHAARAEFERRYTAEANYKMLMEIYQSAISRGTT